MNELSYVDQVLRLARQRSLTVSEADAESALPHALADVADSLIGTDRASLLQRRFLLTYDPSTFDAPFSTLLLDNGDALSTANIDHIMTETITNVEHEDSGTITVFHRIPRDSDYDFERTMEFYFYDPFIVKSNKIRAKKADGSSLNAGTFTFESMFTTTLAGWPPELDTDLIKAAVMNLSTGVGVNA